MKHIVFIGQAPARPTSKHEIPGTYLYAWLHSIDFSDEYIRNYCHFYALTDTFPGTKNRSHLPPTKEQITSRLPILKQEIASIAPDVIVPVGRLAILEILQIAAPLEQIIGHSYTINPLDALSSTIQCTPLPHPSGRSVWNQTHKSHVKSALSLLKDAATR